MFSFSSMFISIPLNNNDNTINAFSTFSFDNFFPIAFIWNGLFILVWLIKIVAPMQEIWLFWDNRSSFILIAVAFSLHKKFTIFNKSELCIMFFSLCSGASAEVLSFKVIIRPGPVMFVVVVYFANSFCFLFRFF